MKKIRNNILKSGTKSTHKRDLLLGSHHIRWDHWVEAYNWDASHHGYLIHRKLTETHVFPTNKDKMRNQLAEDCLDWETLNLMKVTFEIIIMARHAKTLQYNLVIQPVSWCPLNRARFGYLQLPKTKNYSIHLSDLLNLSYLRI